MLLDVALGGGCEPSSSLVGNQLARPLDAPISCLVGLPTQRVNRNGTHGYYIARHLRHAQGCADIGPVRCITCLPLIPLLTIAHIYTGIVPFQPH